MDWNAQNWRMGWMVSTSWARSRSNPVPVATIQSPLRSLRIVG
jgi:hypothetical protein